MAAGIITDTGDLFSLENLFNSYEACRKHKRGTVNCQRFEVALLDNLCRLSRELKNRTYRPATSICFVQQKPKMREIFAADFRDRVVHHLLVGYLEPIYERIFIHDSHACRVGKGVHGGVNRLRWYLNKVTANGTKQAWYLKLDIRGFFMNLDKEILYRLVCKKTKRDSVRWLAARIIFHDCTRDYTFKGQRSLLDMIPPHKTLFKVPKGKGLPIGNLTSQFFANVYLNELDQFVKRRLGCGYYLRYCDDFILLDESREQLEMWHKDIDCFLREQLQLVLNPTQYRLRSVSSGIDFLGYIVRRKYVLVRRRVVNNLQERLDCFDKVLAERKGAGNCRGVVTGDIARRGGLQPSDSEQQVARPCGRSVQIWRYPEKAMEQFRATVNSYLGHMQWADSHRLVRSLFARHPVLRASFYLTGNKAMPRYIPDFKKGSLSRQYLWWSEKGMYYSTAAPVLVFFKVGRFYELYNKQAEIASTRLGLKSVIGLHGFRRGCGFHYSRLGKYLDLARQQGFHVALLREHKDTDGRISRRLARFFGACSGTETVPIVGSGPRGDK